MDAAPGQLRKTPSIHDLIWIQDVNQVVRNRLSLGGTRFCCANVQATIELAGITADDLSLKLAGEIKAEVGLANCSRADNDRD